MSEEIYLRVIKNGKQTVLIRNRGDSKIKIDIFQITENLIMNLQQRLLLKQIARK